MYIIAINHTKTETRTTLAGVLAFLNADKSIPRKITAESVTVHSVANGAIPVVSLSRGRIGLRPAGSVHEILTRVITEVERFILKPDGKVLQPYEVSRDSWEPAELIAFLRFKPELLVAKERTRDIENLPSPRGWGMVGKQMPVVPAGLEAIAFTGAVGSGAAVELQAFRETFRSLPSVGSVLLAPDTARIPEEPSARIGIATAVAGQATAANIDRILVYADRMYDGGHGDCATMMISDAVRRDESIVAAPAFITAQSGWIGAAMDGR